MHGTANRQPAANASSVRVAVYLAPDDFELAIADADQRIVEHKPRSCAAFPRCIDNGAARRILTKACGSAPYWARRFQRIGHQPLLLPGAGGRGRGARQALPFATALTPAARP